MAQKVDTPRWYDLRIIDRAGIFHVHQHSTREAARTRINRMARMHYPADEGYTYKGTGKESDCVTVLCKGAWVADVACEILEHTPEDDAA